MLKTAFNTVGAFRVPVSLLIPSDVDSGESVNALFEAWHVAQETSPVELNLTSLKSRSPSSILASDWGLSEGIGTVGKPRGLAVTSCICDSTQMQKNNFTIFIEETRVIIFN